MSTVRRLRVINACILMLFMVTSCRSVMTSSRQTHGGIKYTIAPDERFHRVEKGKNGSLMYDSPELTVVCENGMLKINGQQAGPVQKGDHVEITDTFQVMVNGQHRGDVTTGHTENKQRIQQSKFEVQTKSR